MEYWPYTSARSEVETALHVPTGVVAGVLLTADGGSEDGTGAVAVVTGVLLIADDDAAAEQPASSPNARSAAATGRIFLISLMPVVPPGRSAVAAADVG